MKTTFTLGLKSGIVGLLLLCSCATTPNKKGVDDGPRSDYFYGEFLYFADAALFFDCTTGLKFRVDRSAGYLSAEKSYLSLVPAPEGERRPIQFYGHLDTLPRPDEEGSLPIVVIDSLIAMNDAPACEKNFQLSGIYTPADSTLPRQTLHLLVNRTFKWSRFTKEGASETIEGRWGLTGALELSLHPNTTSMEATGDAPTQILLQILPGKESLVSIGTEANDKMVLTKEYL